MRNVMTCTTFALWVLLCGRVMAAESRMIEVCGEGLVEVEPDMAHLKVGVTTMSEEAKWN